MLIIDKSLELTTEQGEAWLRLFKLYPQIVNDLAADIRMEGFGTGENDGHIVVIGSSDIHSGIVIRKEDELMVNLQSTIAVVHSEVKSRRIPKHKFMEFILRTETEPNGQKRCKITSATYFKTLDEALERSPKILQPQIDSLDSADKHVALPLSFEQFSSNFKRPKS